MVRACCTIISQVCSAIIVEICYPLLRGLPLIFPIASATISIIVTSTCRCEGHLISVVRGVPRNYLLFVTSRFSDPLHWSVTRAVIIASSSSTVIRIVRAITIQVVASSIGVSAWEKEIADIDLKNGEAEENQDEERKDYDDYVGQDWRTFFIRNFFNFLILDSFLIRRFIICILVHFLCRNWFLWCFTQIFFFVGERNCEGIQSERMIEDQFCFERMRDLIRHLHHHFVLIFGLIELVHRVKYKLCFFRRSVINLYFKIWNGVQFDSHLSSIFAQINWLAELWLDCDITDKLYLKFLNFLRIEIFLVPILSFDKNWDWHKSGHISDIATGHILENTKEPF